MRAVESIVVRPLLTEKSVALARKSKYCFAVAPDATKIEVRNAVTGAWSLVPLAGPANRQGRMAADNIFGLHSHYGGTWGTAVLRLFKLTVACTGANEKSLRKAGLDRLDRRPHGRGTPERLHSGLSSHPPSPVAPARGRTAEGTGNRRVTPERATLLLCQPLSGATRVPRPQPGRLVPHLVGGADRRSEVSGGRNVRIPGGSNKRTDECGRVPDDPGRIARSQASASSAEALR